MLEMKVKFLTFDSTSNGFVVLLMDLSNKIGLPIWIGPFEANAIAMKSLQQDRTSHLDRTFRSQCHRYEAQENWPPNDR